MRARLNLSAPGSLIILSAFILPGCRMKYHRPDIHYTEARRPAAPDYSDLGSWAAHPRIHDNSDRVPEAFGQLQPTAADSLKAVVNAPADVFWIHPTIYTYQPEENFPWNGDIRDEKLNEKVDKTTIRLQTAIFNGAGNIYAPRYRQAHLYAFRTPFKADQDSSLGLAYSDVKQAFAYYLENWNQGKPFIIASHSQGTVHAIRLIREMVEGTELQDRLIAAYLVGIPIPRDSFKVLQPCESPDDIGCVISWCTYAYDYYPSWREYFTEEGRASLISTNPLSWKTDTVTVGSQNNKGGILFKTKKVFPGICNAAVRHGMVWIHPPQFPGSFWVRKVKNYHIGDYNLFYMSVRENAILRTRTYLRQHEKN